MLAMDDVPYRVKLKARILQIVEGILETEGLPAVQARRVAQEADCSVGTLYNVFGGLDGMIVEANAQTLRSFGRVAETGLVRVASEPLDVQLMTLALAYLDFATTHRLRWKAIFNHQMADGAPVPIFYKAEQAKLFGMIEQSLVLSPAMRDAETRGRGARALFSSIHGIVVIALDRKLGEFDARDAELQVRFLIDLLAAGLTRPATID
jgi:AcrR family transcriptional regulator